MAYQTTQALPDDVAQVAATHQLGAFSQVYLPARKSQGTGGTLLLIVSCIPCIIFFTLLRNGQLTGGIGTLLVVAALLIIVLGSLLPALLADGSAVYLFENGIVFRQRRHFTSLLWSQIASCEMSQNAKRCRVSTKDGRTIPIGKLAGYEELGNRIKNSVETH